MVQVLGVQFLDFSRCILPWRTNAPVKNISITQKVSLYVFLVSLCHNNSGPSPGQPVFCFLTSQFSFACLRISYTSNHKACTLLCPGFLLSMMLIRFSNPFFCIGEKRSSYENTTTRSLTRGQMFGCFQFLAVVNKDAVHFVLILWTYVFICFSRDT